jgi:hypothetical protein
MTGEALIGQDGPDLTLKIDFVLTGSCEGSAEAKSKSEASESGHQRGLFCKKTR